MSMNKVVSAAKLEAVEEIKALCEQYKVIGLVRLTKIGSPQITDLRAKLRGIAKIRMAKKGVMKRAFEGIKSKPGLIQLFEKYHEKVGPSALIFTNEKAIKLRRMLDASKTTTKAKAGDVVDRDIMVPAGNTKIPPGPVISELAGAGLPTRIQDGMIHITKDAVVLQAGGMVDNKLAMVLGRLNIEPIEVLLDLYAAYEAGEVIGKEILTINLDTYKDMLLTAHGNALKLSVEAGIVTPENAKIILLKAFTRAKALAMKLPIIFPEFLKEYFWKAQAEALTLNAAVTGEPLAAPAAPAKEPTAAGTPAQEEDKPDEEPDVGLGDLFG